MWTKSISAGAIAASLTLAIALPSAHAADPGFCNHYAMAAVNQSRIVHTNGNCANRVAGPRWAGDFNAHYGWCLGGPYNAANEERDIRRHFIDRCTHGG